MTSAHTYASGGCLSGVRPLAHRERQLRDVACTWVTEAFQSKGRLLFAATFTCRQAIPGPSGDLVWLSRDLLSETLKVFFKRVDWQVYKNASRRAKKRVERFCVVEGGVGTGKRLHVHVLVLAPPSWRIHPTRFIRLLKSNWVSAPWGMKDVRFDLPPTPIAATRYLTKTGLDAVDWFNTEL